MRFPVFRTSRRTPKPETPLRALPTATGRFRPTATGHGRYTVNQPARKPVLLLDAQQRAARLWKRGPLLERPQLHRDHPHVAQDLEDMRAIRLYVEGLTVGPPDLDLTPLAAQTAQTVIHNVRREIPNHKWDQHLRLNDVADQLDLDRGDNTWIIG